MPKCRARMRRRARRDDKNASLPDRAVEIGARRETACAVFDQRILDKAKEISRKSAPRRGGHRNRRRTQVPRKCLTISPYLLPASARRLIRGKYSVRNCRHFGCALLLRFHFAAAMRTSARIIKHLALNYGIFYR